jgi:hypothetical protein
LSEREPLQPVSDSRVAELEAATAAYEEAVTREVADRLKARGIGLAEAVTFRVGVVADPFPGHERFRNFLSIPYLGANGMPLSLRFRCMEEHEHRSFGHGKYMSLKEEPARVFNVGAIHRAKDELHIAEGEFDAMILNKVGFPAIAIPGAQGWAPHHRRMVAGFSRVYVWGDPDEAGAEFVGKVTRAVRNAVGVRMTKADGDVSELYAKGSAQALHDRKNGVV